MKKCMVCEKELVSSLDEFGEPGEEVCQSCWLNDRSSGNDEIQEYLNGIEYLRECIAEQEDDIAESNRLISDYESEIRSIEKKIKNLSPVHN